MVHHFRESRYSIEVYDIPSGLNTEKCPTRVTSRTNFWAQDQSDMFYHATDFKMKENT